MPGSKAHQVFATYDAIHDLAWATREWLQRKKPSPPQRRGSTIRPGPNTPRWNEVVAVIRPLLRKRGAKARLAYELGLHRARITEFFVHGTAMPDAERTLHLLEWYGALARRAGKTGHTRAGAGSGTPAPRPHRPGKA